MHAGSHQVTSAPRLAHCCPSAPAGAWRACFWWRLRSCAAQQLQVRASAPQALLHHIGRWHLSCVPAAQSCTTALRMLHAAEPLRWRSDSESEASEVDHADGHDPAAAAQVRLAALQCLQVIAQVAPLDTGCNILIRPVCLSGPGQVAQQGVAPALDTPAAVAPWSWNAQALRHRPDAARQLCQGEARRALAGRQSAPGRLQFSTSVHRCVLRQHGR